jgi:hypothetical protein
MPVSLQHLREDARFGDRWLQQQLGMIEYRVLGYVVQADQETTLHPVLQDYLSKRLALGLTKPASEYWARQMRTATSTQTSEVVSYPDILQALKDLKSHLIAELTQQWRDMLLVVPGLPQRRVVPLPQSSIGANGDKWSSDFNTAQPRATPRLKTGGFGWGLEFGNWPFP